MCLSPFWVAGRYILLLVGGHVDLVAGIAGAGFYDCQSNQRATEAAFIYSGVLTYRQVVLNVARILLA